MSEPIEDFRRRTARIRRRRTSRLLVQGLLDRADEVGLSALTVDAILTAAGLARGSFYRHFAGLEELLDHAGAAVGAQLNAEMSERFDAVADPATRIGLHVRYQVCRATSDPTCARLLLRLLGRDGTVSEFSRRHALADFEEAVATGRFRAPDATVAADLGHGLLAAIVRHAVDHGHHAEAVSAQVEILLRAFGVAEDDVLTAARVPLPTPPADRLRDRVLDLCGELADRHEHEPGIRSASRAEPNPEGLGKLR